MPQKRNPDGAELVRAKVGRILGDLTSLCVVMKGLPLTYSKDMQEDKPPVFDASEALEISLAAMAGMIEDIEVNKPAMLGAAGAGYTTATDLADWAVRELGLPFRDAHHLAAKAVGLASSRGKGLEDLTLQDYQSIHAGIDNRVFDVLGVQRSVESRTSFGGTAPVRVREQVLFWQEKLA